jgi:hypothetical protein
LFENVEMQRLCEAAGFRSDVNPERDVVKMEMAL